jgi:hypothetical protein
VLRVVALTVSMVIRVMLFRVSPSMHWTKVELRAELIRSRSSRVEDGRGVPSRLMRSLLSQRVGACLSWMEDCLLVGGVVTGGEYLFARRVDFCFFAFFGTIAQAWVGTVRVGLEGGGGGGIGAEVDSGLGAGVDEGGGSIVASLSTKISSLRALICE